MKYLHKLLIYTLDTCVYLLQNRVVKKYLYIICLYMY